MSNIVCEKCGSPYITPGRNQVIDDEGNITEEEVECTDCHNIWTIKYRGMADRDILLSQKSRPLLFCAAHQLESFIKKGIAQAKHKQNLKRAEHSMHWTMGILPPLKHYPRRQRIMVNWLCSSPPHCQ